MRHCAHRIADGSQLLQQTAPCFCSRTRDPDLTGSAEMCSLQIRKWEAGAVHAAAQRRLRRWLHAWSAWRCKQMREQTMMRLAVEHWRQAACRSVMRTWYLISSCGSGPACMLGFGQTRFAAGQHTMANGLGLVHTHCTEGANGVIPCLSKSYWTARSCRQEHAGEHRRQSAQLAAAAAKLQRGRLRRLLCGWAAAPAVKRRHERLVDAAVARGSRKRNLMQVHFTET